MTDFTNCNGVAEVVELLARMRFDTPVFNPWSDVDEAYGMGQAGPEVRRRQLTRYFDARRGRAAWILVGEAMGYQGGHFSGVPMTSERILLGHMPHLGVTPMDVLPKLRPVRTSDPRLKPDGFSEPTATIVWGALMRAGIAPVRVVLWNTFAWHPYQAERGLLSNRRPQQDELQRGLPALRAVLDLFPGARVAAVGRVAGACLKAEGLPVVEMRHPAHGGAPRFRDQLLALASS